MAVVRNVVTSWLLVSVGLSLAPVVLAEEASDRIQPWSENAWYWQYQGKPVLLLGGSDDDNLFQLPNLEAHLDDMAAAGANYIRNTMSDRRDRGFEVYPFAQRPDGKYDLNEWNQEYWDRFANLLQWTKERDIIVQIEVWDRFDYSRENWTGNPWNPKNNVNYTSEESGLATEYPNHPGRNEQPFFFTTPEQHHNEVLLPIQKRFVQKMLDHALEYPNVLFCMDNETNGEEAWGKYWAEFIQQEADRRGVEVFQTEMWDNWDLSHEEHRRTFDHPERYRFVDVSQNNHQKGQTHWDNFQWTRKYLSDHPRPINTVKTYGADGNKFGHSNRDGLERFFRHVLGGAASARFHRPESGLGFSRPAENAIRSARKLEARIPMWEVEPAEQLLRSREENEAYVAADPGKKYALYFPDGGEIELNLTNQSSEFTVTWINAETAEEQPGDSIAGNRWVRLAPPGNGHWLAAVTAK